MKNFLKYVTSTPFYVYAELFGLLFVVMCFLNTNPVYLFLAAYFFLTARIEKVQHTINKLIVNSKDNPAE